ncbi:hypothetical protein K458DRAFT_440602 [Lentithecium fluviatile CBS 122367]|uniref:Frequency clock protein n=1 Tax=Lentithecium fluviatile CBS 122367 TaxID=1168545 RepID=A0A6G1JCC3_9PLEO|nr:hypothetical protein K458DRAFT_440602 [Lentithecium fluviatile CBS 122367]
MNGPGTIPPQQHTSHPRRPPAHKSVSLRHSPPAGLPPKAVLFRQSQPTSPGSPNPASDQANPPSSISPKFQCNKHSSGESSDAGKWFENTNAQKSHASFADNDPPFFLRNSSSSETPPEGNGSHDHMYQRASAMPFRPGLARLGSSTEDFRSVIDDLTVANKKLKQKLRKYERLYDAHLQDEKLFEVRFHGLRDHKKKELEETLRNFAAELDDSGNSDNPPISHQPTLFHPQKTASSLNSRFAESGYASMSASGQNSSAPSNQTSLHPSVHSGHDNDRRGMTKSQYHRQQQSIHSYLHDIPLGLLPKTHAPMSEKAKKKLVVRRLEQVFAGKQSAPGTHQQPLQQEEVAQSAAMADRQAKEATGQRYKSEGHREARMVLPTDQADTAESGNGELLQTLRPQFSINEQDFTGSGSPDQRPTRPLDLDPYRAQVPTENMEYIRHLGFTPPDMVTGEAPPEGHGWLYLNLLINMAQLHTLNVTPDFVKEAVSEYSSKFELSVDGRRIRWKGGYDVTMNSGDSSSEHLSGNSAFESLTGGNGKSSPKRIKMGNSGSSESNQDPERKAKRIARAKKEREQNKFAYTPIFFHKEESEEDNDFFDIGSSGNSPFQAQQAGDSSGFSSSAMYSSSSRKKRDDGPMIFYNRMKFCTDLTGDRQAASSHSPGDYQTITTQPLGVTSVTSTTIQRSGSEVGGPRRMLDDMTMDTDSKDARTSSSEEELNFSPDTLNDDNGTDSSDVMDFEASGLGGVQPDDNFAIRVRRSQTQTASVDNLTAYRKSKPYPKKILEALAEHPEHHAEGSSPPQQHSVIKEEIISAYRKTLPSSALPPASFLPFDSTSSGDVDSDLDDDSDVSSSPSDSGSSESDPATALQLLNISPFHIASGLPAIQANESDDESSSSLSDEEDSDGGSIDFLTTARKVDPTTIQASEREYNATLAERLTEEIPAGSSAATAGGGSGFNSPASGAEAGKSSTRVRAKRHSTTSGSISSRTKNLKRTMTRDSLATTVQGSKAPKSQKVE